MTQGYQLDHYYHLDSYNIVVMVVGWLFDGGGSSDFKDSPESKFQFPFLNLPFRVTEI